MRVIRESQPHWPATWRTSVRQSAPGGSKTNMESSANPQQPIRLTVPNPEHRTADKLLRTLTSAEKPPIRKGIKGISDSVIASCQWRRALGIVAKCRPKFQNTESQYCEHNGDCNHLRDEPCTTLTQMPVSSTTRKLRGQRGRIEEASSSSLHVIHGLTCGEHSVLPTLRKRIPLSHKVGIGETTPPSTKWRARGVIGGQYPPAAARRAISPPVKRSPAAKTHRVVDPRSRSKPPSLPQQRLPRPRPSLGQYSLYNHCYLNDSSCRWSFSGYSRFPRPLIPAPLQPRFRHQKGVPCPGKQVLARRENFGQRIPQWLMVPWCRTFSGHSCFLAVFIANVPDPLHRTKCVLSRNDFACPSAGSRRVVPTELHRRSSVGCFQRDSIFAPAESLPSLTQLLRLRGWLILALSNHVLTLVKVKIEPRRSAKTTGKRKYPEKTRRPSTATSLTSPRAKTPGDPAGTLTQGGGGGVPEKTCRPTTSSGTISTCENPLARQGIESGSHWWEASVLIAQSPWLARTTECMEHRKVGDLHRGIHALVVTPGRPLVERGIRFAIYGAQLRLPITHLGVEVATIVAVSARRDELRWLLPRASCTTTTNKFAIHTCPRVLSAPGRLPWRARSRLRWQRISDRALDEAEVGELPHVTGTAANCVTGLPRSSCTLERLNHRDRGVTPADPPNSNRTPLQNGRRNERAGETGDPRENPPTNGIVRHDSYIGKSGLTRPGIEPEPPC
ncbi:hypothetical protein PR048_017636 [Dryococelus australis]|uniref:Uncharacterized protein n=1 Tax=Dryococelus australis TaxID=614101 RepID=A0ABQ9HA45_9NEOP|nr:hypothetical protein PR048_017636 [Dryococelus australis]